MFDLLITTAVLFVGYILFFCCIKYMKLFIPLLSIPNFIIIVILYFDNSIKYKNYSLWENPQKYKPFHKTDFLPIKSINGIYDASNLKDLDFGKTDGIFSIVKNDEYSKECLHNYFIKQTSDCPITDIILETTQVLTHSNYIELKIPNSKYLYYKKENNLDGKLYQIKLISSDSLCNGNNEFRIDSKCFRIVSNFNSKDVSSIIESEEQKKSNPFKSLKNYAYYSDKICLLLILLTFAFTTYEPFENKKFTAHKILNWVCHFFVLILLTIRYHKFRKLKEYFNQNKDERTFNKYVPLKAFNLDTVPISISILIFIYIILYIIIPSKWHCRADNEKENDNVNSGQDFLNTWRKKVFSFILPLFTIFCFMILYDVMNDIIIEENYIIITCNWKQNSLQSISEYNHLSLNSFAWKDIYILNNLNEYNYYDISKKDDNSKICGKDSQGNDLYFPKDVECPINDIFVSKFGPDKFPDYTKIQLINDGGEVEYLYYTNKKTTGKIVVAVVIAKSDLLKINAGMDTEEYKKIFDKTDRTDIEKKIDRFTSIFFYEEIDRWERVFENIPVYDDDYEIIDYRTDISLYKLYAINYLGVKNKLIGKVKGFGENLDKYKKLTQLKYNSYAIYVFDFIYYSCVFIFENVQPCYYCFGTILLATVIYFIIINLWCLHINITYVVLLLDRINIDFENNKSDCIWNILLTLIGIIFSIYFVFIIVLGFIKNCDCPKKGNDTNPIDTNEVVIRYFEQEQEQEQQKQKESEEKRDSKEELDKIFKDKGKDPTCVVCLNNKAIITINPCTHKCVCETCFNVIFFNSDKKCPICQQNILGKFSSQNNP